MGHVVSLICRNKWSIASPIASCLMTSEFFGCCLAPAGLASHSAEQRTITMDVDYDDEVAEEGGRPAGRRMKGRGGEEDDRYAGKAGKFERLDDDDDETGAARSIEGWVVIVSGVHEEAQEDDIFEAFSEYGDIKNLHLNLDRRTGFVKGYAFIEYENKQEADAAIKAMDGNSLLDHKLDVSWAFAKPGSKKKRR